MVKDMKKIFKSRKSKKINIGKIILTLLISFFAYIIINKINLFKTEKFINILKNTSMNEINLKSIDMKGEYLINIGL